LQKFYRSKMAVMAASMAATPLTWAALAWAAADGGEADWELAPPESTTVAVDSGAAGPPAPDVIVKRVVVVRRVAAEGAPAPDGVQAAGSQEGSAAPAVSAPAPAPRRTPVAAARTRGS
jgi:hypothetical protein